MALKFHFDLLTVIVVQGIFYWMISLQQVDGGISNFGVPHAVEAGLRQHHVVRRAIDTSKDPFNHTYQCDTTGIPNPSPEYPAILFREPNYNNCSSSGFYVKLRPGQSHAWCINNSEKRRRHVIYASLLMLPGINVTFRGCCPSGNDFIKSLSDWRSTPDFNHSVYYQTNLSLTTGIWYQDWLHWETSYYFKVDAGQDFSANLPSCGTCFFGQCGLAGKCECAPGYSGNQCQTRPTNDFYPTQQYPLILFKETNFEGVYKKVQPDTYNIFAANRQNSKINEYQSMRVLHNRTVIFSRNNVFPVTLTVGSDIADIPKFMLANPDIGRGTWYNYDSSMEASFSVKVIGNPRCDNCSVSHGCCYTGTCNCFPGYTGVNCDTAI